MSKLEYKTWPPSQGELTKKEIIPLSGGEREDNDMATDRVAEIIEGLKAMQQRFDRWERATGGGSWETQERRLSTGQVVPLGDPRGTSLGNRGAPGVIHSRGEHPYSVARAMRSVFEKDKALAPGEWAISQKLEALGYHSSTAGAIQIPLGLDVWAPAGKEQEAEQLSREIKSLFPPLTVDPDEVSWLRSKMGSKAMDPLDETGGGSLIPYPIMGALIDLLRPASAVMRASAYQVPLPPQGTIEYPRLKSDATFTWGPPSNVNISESTPGTGTVKLEAKRATAFVLLPMDLVRYSVGAAEAMVRRSLMLRGALTLDLAALEGSGGTASPLGLINLPRSAADVITTDAVTLHVAKGVGATGDTFSPSDVLVMLSNVEEANTQATGWIMRPRMLSGLLNSRTDAVVTGDSAGLFLFPVNRGDIANGMPTALSGVPVYVTTQVSKSRTKGQGTGLTYIVCGDFSKLYIGMAAGIELASSVDYAFQADQLALRAVLRGDCSPAWNQAFCIADSLKIPT